MCVLLLIWVVQERRVVNTPIIDNGTNGNVVLKGIFKRASRKIKFEIYIYYYEKPILDVQPDT